jgi:folate-dependent phosphoribosylglycinamide formyltransferase PurN
MYQLGWFSTGRDKAARDLLSVVQQSLSQGEIEGEINFVFSNRELGESRESDLFFQLVSSYHLPLICLSSKQFKNKRGELWREEYEREVMGRLAIFQPDLCILSGYMLIAGEKMCRQFKMLNLHPSPPGGPAGTWQEVIWKLIETKATLAGAMMHLVTPELDKGPVATYCTFPIRGETFDSYWQEVAGKSIEELKQAGEQQPLFQLIRSYELTREFPLLLATIKAFSQGKLNIERGKVVDAKGKTIEGYDLTKEIEALLFST